MGGNDWSDFHQTEFILALIAAGMLAVAHHLDLIYQRFVARGAAQRINYSTLVNVIPGGSDAESYFCTKQVVSESMAHLIGWGLMLTALGLIAEKTHEDQTGCTHQTEAELTAWAVVPGVVIFLCTVTAKSWGESFNTKMHLPNALCDALIFFSWISLGMFAALHRPYDHKRYAIVGGSALAFAELMLQHTKMRGNDGTIGDAGWYFGRTTGSLIYIAASFFFVLGLCRKIDA